MPPGPVQIVQPELNNKVTHCCELASYGRSVAEPFPSATVNCLLAFTFISMIYALVSF